MSYTIKGVNKFIKLSEQIPKEPESWTCEDVSIWLNLIEMGQYAQIFKEMSIDGMMIFEIEEEDLTSELKICKKLHRKKILKGIKILKEYKSYIQNHLTTKDYEDQSLFEQMAEKSKEFLEGEKGKSPGQASLDDQTQPQNISPNFRNPKSKVSYSEYLEENTKIFFNPKITLPRMRSTQISKKEMTRKFWKMS